MFIFEDLRGYLSVGLAYANEQWGFVSLWSLHELVHFAMCGPARIWRDFILSTIRAPPGWVSVNDDAMTYAPCYLCMASFMWTSETKRSIRWTTNRRHSNRNAARFFWIDDDVDDVSIISGIYQYLSYCQKTMWKRHSYKGRIYFLVVPSGAASAVRFSHNCYYYY